jgi:hypothetical protein
MPPLELALVATNGRTLIAESHGYPLHFLEMHGLQECSCPTCPERQRLGNDRRRISHEALRGVVIEADHEIPERPGWTQVPDKHSLVVGLDRVARVVANA